MCLCLTNFLEIYHYVLNVCASQYIYQSPKPKCGGTLGDMTFGEELVLGKVVSVRRDPETLFSTRLPAPSQRRKGRR